MEYYLELLEALDEYDMILENEPTDKESLRDWSTRCGILERRIRWLFSQVST